MTPPRLVPLFGGGQDHQAGGRIRSEAPRQGERQRPFRFPAGAGEPSSATQAGARSGADPGRDRFLATLFHELRNPLSTARSWLFILRHAPPGREQADHGLEVIDRQLALLLKLVEDLLDVSRIREGKILLERTRVDLGELARGAAEDHEAVFAANGVDLRAEIAREPIWVHGDGARLTQVLANLLQNAAKFTPRGGRVALALRADAASRMACLRLRDSGLGFDPSSSETLFRPFEQAEATAARSAGGLGLGLALVRGLVELHGGTVEARSEGTGTGAEFTIRLPLATAYRTPYQPGPPAVTFPRTGR